MYGRMNRERILSALGLRANYPNKRVDACSAPSQMSAPLPRFRLKVSSIMSSTFLLELSSVRRISIHKSVIFALGNCWVVAARISIFIRNHAMDGTGANKSARNQSFTLAHILTGAFKRQFFN